LAGTAVAQDRETKDEQPLVNDKESSLVDDESMTLVDGEDSEGLTHIKSLLELAHYGVFDADVADPFTVITLGLLGQWRNYQLGMRLPINKNYVVDPHQPEWEVQDTFLSASKQLPSYVSDLEFSSGGSLSLPSSQDSRKNGRQTRLGMQFGAVKVWSLLASQTQVFSRYYVNQYKTTVSDGGSGGVPLPWFSYGLNQSFSAKWHPKWTGSLSGSYSELWFEKTNGEDSVGSWLPEHPYAVDLAATYEPEDGMAATLGVSQGSRFEQYGRVEFSLFDTYASYWYLAFSHTLGID
jgi:hypothetical protein